MDTSLQESLRRERIKNRTIPYDIDTVLHELKKIEPTSDDVMFRLDIIGYEYGDLQRALVYMKRFKDTDKVKAYNAEGKLALADMLTMLQMLCITLDWDFEELRKLGVEHLRERQHEFIEKKMARYRIASALQYCKWMIDT